MHVHLNVLLTVSEHHIERQIKAGLTRAQAEASAVARLEERISDCVRWIDGVETDDGIRVFLSEPRVTARR